MKTLIKKNGIPTSYGFACEIEEYIELLEWLVERRRWSDAGIVCSVLRKALEALKR